MTTLPIRRVAAILGPHPTAHAGGLRAHVTAAVEGAGYACTLAVCGDTAAVAAAVRAADADALLVACGGAGDDPALRAAVIERDLPAVHVDLAAAVERPVPVPAWLCQVHGRGLDGFRWALKALAARTAWPYETVLYGPEPENVAHLRLPAGDAPAAGWPLVALLHGGFWMDQWEFDLMDGLGADLAQRGYASLNLEFRRIGVTGGGWPGTFADVAAALDHLPELAQAGRPLDLSRVALVGHSAGGHLVLWAGCARDLAGQHPVQVGFRPALVVTVSGCNDLAETERRGLGDGAVSRLLGGRPDQLPERYAAACGSTRLDPSLPVVAVIGLNDHPDLVDESRLLVERLQALGAGANAELVEIEGGDHFTVIDAATPSWERIVAVLDARL